MENNSAPLGQESVPGNGAAELRSAIAQTRLVFKGSAHAE